MKIEISGEGDLEVTADDAWSLTIEYEGKTYHIKQEERHLVLYLPTGMVYLDA